MIKSLPVHTFAVLAYGTHGHPILSGRFEFHGGTIDATESLLAYMLGQHFDQFDLQHLGSERCSVEVAAPVTPPLSLMGETHTPKSDNF